MNHKRLSVLLSLLLLTISYQHTATAQTPPTPKNVIISTDLAAGLSGGWRAGYSDIDDGMAVAMANFSGQFNILGVVVTFGNNYMEPEFQVAKRLINQYMGTTIPVYRGAAVALNSPALQSLVSPKSQLCNDNEGVEFMHVILQKQQASILAIGPLTDVACLITLHPQDMGNIQLVVAIMGRAPGQAFTINGHGGLTDFNMRRDPEAVSTVLATSVPVTLIGFSVTSQDLITADEVQTTFSGTNGSIPLAKFFLKAANNWLVQWNEVYKFNEVGFHPWDQNAVYFLMNPFAYNCSSGDPQIVSCGPPSYSCAGQSAGSALLCPSASSPVGQCSLQTYSPQWADSQGEQAQLWIYPTAGVGRVTYCSSYAQGGQAKFHAAALEVLPPQQQAKPKPKR